MSEQKRHSRMSVALALGLGLALGALGTELKSGYQRIHHALKKD